MNAATKPAGTDWNGMLATIEQTGSQILAVESLLETLHSQLRADFDALERYKRPVPEAIAIIVAKVLKHHGASRPKAEKFALAYKGERYPCKHYKDLLVRLLRRIREDNPVKWDEVAACLNEGCRAGLRTARSRSDLLPGYTADKQRSHSETIGGGWYVSKLSLDKPRIEKLVGQVCDVAGLALGTDVQIVE